jgi:glycosyltransferase involved in cell wall biosynthesis
MIPKRILIFSLVYYPRFIGGAEVAIKETTDRIAPGEIEFDMITLRFDSRLPAFERIGNVNVYRIGSSVKRDVSPENLPWYLHLNKYFYVIGAFKKAVTLHRSRQYSMIWSLMASYNTFAALFFKLTHPKVKFLFTLQDGDPIAFLKRRALPMYPLFKMFFTRADHIQAISNYLAEWAKDMKAHCPISVIPNGVDYDFFAKDIGEAELTALKTKLGKTSDDTFLVTTSRLVKKNAIGDIIDALLLLPVSVKLLILGNGPDENDLKDQIRKLKLEERVQFRGYVSHNEIVPYLKVSDIFVRPSLSEGLGVSFLEAMAAGIPIIATPVGGIPDFLKNGETGLFCDVGDPESIAQKVEKLMKDQESREYIVRNAKALVREKYSWTKTAMEIKKIFNE